MRRRLGAVPHAYLQVAWHWYWECTDLQVSPLPGVQESQHLAEVKAKDPELRHASPPQGNTLNEWLATHVAAAGQVLDRHRTNQKFPYIRARRSRRSLPIL